MFAQLCSEVYLLEMEVISSEVVQSKLVVEVVEKQPV
jgi:hypothetical protein